MTWSDGKCRCRWANPGNPRYIRYHDEEWGVPVHDDRRLFEMLILEGFQAGLSWECVLNKQEAFRRAFDLATAMECRCYHGGEGRTKMKVLHVSGGDMLSLGLSCLACAVVIVCNFVFPSLR